MGKHIIEILENTLEKGIFFLEKKLDSSTKKRRTKKVEQERKKLLEREVDYLHDDLSNSEKKGIVSQYYKSEITPPSASEKKKQFVTQLEYKRRMKEIEELEKTNTKELTR